MKYIIMTILFFQISIQAKEYQIQMLNSDNGQSMTFSPSYLELKVGDKVKFIAKAKGHITHSVYSGDKVTKWSGKTNEEVSVQFDNPGYYIYECKNHGVMGMAGVIKVGEAKDRADAINFAQEFEKKFIMNKKRLTQILSKTDS